MVARNTRTCQKVSEQPQEAQAYYQSPEQHYPT